MPSMGTPDPADLRSEQERRRQAEAEQAVDAGDPDEREAHRRRAEKAAYLRDRLTEQEEALDD